MSREIVGLMCVYAGIIVIWLALKQWVIRLGIGVVGLILILQPIGMLVYSSVPPVAVAVSAVLGVFLLLVDVKHQVNDSE